MPLYDHFFLILFIRYLLLAIAGDSMLREMELTQSSHYCVLTFCWKEAYTFKTKFKLGATMKTHSGYKMLSLQAVNR